MCIHPQRLPHDPLEHIASGNSSRFVHLHNHSEFSILDGIVKVKEYILNAKKLGMPGIALTDHMHSAGILPFLLKAKEEGIKPICGIEANVVEDMFNKSSNTYYHLTVLAKDNEGLKGIYALNSEGHIRGKYYKPRTMFKRIAELKGHVVILSGCLRGIINTCLVNSKIQQAKEYALWFKEVFQDDFYLEIMNHGLKEQKKINPYIQQIAQDANIKIIATNDCHYISKSDWEVHDVFLCLQTKTTLNAPNRMKLDNPEFYLKSYQEMAALFPEEYLSNSLEVMEKCNVDIDCGEIHMPAFQVPKDTKFTNWSTSLIKAQKQEVSFENLCKSIKMKNNLYLKYLTFKGLAKLGILKKTGAELQVYIDRANHEFKIIQELNIADYFLIVSDYIQEAKKAGISIGPGRGSAAGSLVIFALEITTVDPIENNLSFYRFLNPVRRDYPDIDIDIEHVRRNEVISYLTNKYGENNTAYISAWSTFKGRSVVRAVARVLEIQSMELNAIIDTIPDTPNTLMENVVKESKKIQKYIDRYPKLFKMSLMLEGLMNFIFKHAAGFIIASNAIHNICPLMTVKDKKTKEDNIVTQYDKRLLKKVGLIKLDLLGLKELSILKFAEKLIKKRHGKQIVFVSTQDQDRLSQYSGANLELTYLDNPQIFETLRAGDTVGVFQVESKGFSRLLKDLKISEFETLVQSNAGYRPGAMDMMGDYIAQHHNPDLITYMHPSLEPILKPTKGIILFQEQCTQIASDIANYTPGHAELFRKAICDKDEEKLIKEKDTFVKGCITTGLSSSDAESLFNYVKAFGSYGFNRAHALCYALFTCWDAYIKSHYPVEFYASLLEFEENKGKNKLSKYIFDCKRHDIPILLPDVNFSKTYFKILDKDIMKNFTSDPNIKHGLWYALSKIKYVGVDAAKAIEEKQPYLTFSDFYYKIDRNKINKSKVEALIKCRAFRSLKYTVKQLWENLPQIIPLFQKKGQGHIAKIQTEHLLKIWLEEQKRNNEPIEYDEQTLIDLEQDALGFYLSRHPLQEYASHPIYKMSNYTTLDQIEDLPAGLEVTVVVVVLEQALKKSKSGNQQHIITLDDTTDIIDVRLYLKQASTPDPITGVLLIDKLQKRSCVAVTIRKNLRGNLSIKNVKSLKS